MKRWLMELDALVQVALLLIALVCVSAAAAHPPTRTRRQSGLCEDRLTQCQTTLQPHYCYVEHNRRLCCRTCQALRRQRNDPDCPYGDHNAQISRQNDDDGVVQSFTCRSYVEFYGDFHCRNEHNFRQYCCETCQQHDALL